MGIFSKKRRRTQPFAKDYQKLTEKLIAEQNLTGDPRRLLETLTETTTEYSYGTDTIRWNTLGHNWETVDRNHSIEKITFKIDRNHDYYPRTEKRTFLLGHQANRVLQTIINTLLKKTIVLNTTDHKDHLPYDAIKEILTVVLPEIARNHILATELLEAEKNSYQTTNYTPVGLHKELQTRYERSENWFEQNEQTITQLLEEYTKLAVWREQQKRKIATAHADAIQISDTLQQTAAQPPQNLTLNIPIKQQTSPPEISR